MADQNDGQERSEQPTERRKKQSREKGQVARSKELNIMLSLMFGGAGLMLLGGPLAEGVAQFFARSLSFDAAAAFDENRMIEMFAIAITDGLIILAPFMALMVIASLIGPLAMGGANFSWSAMSFKLEKINPLTGLKRIFSVQGLMELLKAILKVTIIGGCAYAFYNIYMDDVIGLSYHPADEAAARTSSLLIWELVFLSISMILVAGFDVPFQLWNHTRQLKMTLQEVKDEAKETEGRPEVKSKIKQLQREIAQRSMLADVQTADVIITNPTHFSVAIKYDTEKSVAPLVVAKGQDLIAMHIRKIAKEHDVMVCEAPPLARALYWNVEIGQEIPKNLYLAVARILAYVFQLNAGLALNVASTRVVLLEGQAGAGAAGSVIEAFGEFVIGGNYAVGLVVFAILVIINFVVVTKGAGRVSEVTARFTLDAMPGKQMAIDADLNAGLITQDEALRRREDVGSEADFYGAMDGASKFVRGDAIAGILILFINILGGMAIGTMQHSLSMSQAAENYVLLTIGDGLAAQIPSLLLSTATAIIITRVSDSQDMGQQVMSQMMGNPKVLFMVAALIGFVGIIPGMPNLVFISIAGVIGYLGYSKLNVTEEQPVEEEVTQEEAPTEARDLSWDDVTPVDQVGLEVGYKIISLVDKNQGGILLSRIKGVRKKLSQELGFLLHPVHVRDNLELAPNSYRISFHDVTMGEGEVYPGKELAINPGQVFGELDGIATKDPTFGLDALWIEGSQRDEAQALGFTVVDSSTVIATHLSQLFKNNAADLIGQDEVQSLLDILAKSSPKLVESLVPDMLNLATVSKVMQNLLSEGVPLRDIRTIAEALTAAAANSQDPDVLTGQVGMLGLINAAGNYDATQGASFETYASIRIRGAMLDELIDELLSIYACLFYQLFELFRDNRGSLCLAHS
eukprot:g4383.t1